MVTGGGGFPGSGGRENGSRPAGVSGSSSHGLPTMTFGRPAGVQAALDAGRPEIVIHLARSSAASGRTGRTQGRFFLRERRDGPRAHGAVPPGRRGQVRLARHGGSYPKFTPVHSTKTTCGTAIPRNERTYGIAKKIAPRPGSGVSPTIRVQRHPPDPGQSVRPGDNFDPASSHVIPALIKSASTPKRVVTTTSRSGERAGLSRVPLRSTTPRKASSSAHRYDGAEPVNLALDARSWSRSRSRRSFDSRASKGEVRWDSSSRTASPAGPRHSRAP